MAKLRATPKSYSEAAQYLAGRDSVKLGNNTWLVRMDDHANPKLSQISVRLHNTYIVRFHLEGRVTLHTGGYRTATTKERLNRFITGRIHQDNFNWYYQTYLPMSNVPQSSRPFEEGMEVALYGKDYV